MPPSMEGIIPPLVTPLLETGGFDETGFGALVDRVLGGGVKHLFALGTTGESPSLAMELKRGIARLAGELCRGRARLLVNVTSTALPEVFDLSDRAAEAGAQALVLAPPFYFPLTQDELAGYFERVIPRLPLPVYLYNYPQVFKTPIGLETLERLSGLPHLAGLKDSSGDLKYFAEARRRFPPGAGFGLYCGPEELLAEALDLGADGGVSGGANLFPRLYLDLFDAHRRGDGETVARLRDTVLRVSRCIYGVSGGYAGSIRGIKCALEALGVCGGATAEPLGPLPEEPRARIAESARALENEIG